MEFLLEFGLLFGEGGDGGGFEVGEDVGGDLPGGVIGAKVFRRSLFEDEVLLAEVVEEVEIPLDAFELMLDGTGALVLFFGHGGNGIRFRSRR